MSTPCKSQHSLVDQSSRGFDILKRFYIFDYEGGCCGHLPPTRDIFTDRRPKEYTSLLEI